MRKRSRDSDDKEVYRPVLKSKEEILREQYKFVDDDDDDEGDGYGDGSSESGNRRRPKNLDKRTKQIVEQYNESLYREYVIAQFAPSSNSASTSNTNHSAQKEPARRMGLRWRTSEEVISGKGESICGVQGCMNTNTNTNISIDTPTMNKTLSLFELNFAYIENGKKKNALVKLVCCQTCTPLLREAQRRRKE